VITKQDLTNRDGGAAADGRRRPDTLPDEPSAAERLAFLRQRMLQARELKPSGKDLHCSDCFQRGRDAVLRLLGDPV